MNDISTVVEDPRDDYSSSYAPAAEDTLKYKYHWRRGLIKRRVVSGRKWSEVKRILPCQPTAATASPSREVTKQQANW